MKFSEPPQWRRSEDRLAQSDTKAPKLLDRVCQKMRLLLLAKRTEEAYLGWIKGFLGFFKSVMRAQELHFS